AIAIPSFSTYRSRAFLCEGYELSTPIKSDILEYRDYRGFFPENNLELGYPGTIKGKYVENIRVNNGSIEIIFNKHSGDYSEEVITLNPVQNEGYPTGPIVWEEKRSF
ncbi:MAG: pilin, partial [Proteobacteria bacterium]|nr:pilin [Pseudomonadota bacterium]